MKESKIRHLLKTLDNATGIDEAALGDKIKAIGFKCRKCARCCREEYGDNTVFIFPFEIRCICEKTGLGRDDFVIPTPSQDRDSKGNIHTFEWVLRKNGDCIFLKKGLCGIYEVRPYICKTYPFYLLEGNLMVSECEGLGGAMGGEESRKLAALLKERYIAEIKESAALLERWSGFKPSGIGICVHDSEGEHWV
jgi:Fe-S-cluster containining protein